MTKIRNRQYEQFEAMVREHFTACYGADVTVDIRDVRKNNSVVLRGMTLLKEESKMMPTMYLEEFYEAYCKGTPAAELLEKMEQSYRRSMQPAKVDITYFRDFTRVRETLCIKLVNYEKNEQFLTRVPHRRFLDLAYFCQSRVRSAELPNAVITIEHSHVRLWEIDEEELFAQAVSNSIMKQPSECLAMEEMLGSLLEMEAGELDEMCQNPGAGPMMCVLTNADRIHGAGVLVYPDTLRNCACQMQQDFFVLPSSIHELILTADDGSEPDDMIEMVRMVNDEQVSAEEILSYHVYRYEIRNHVLRDLVSGECISI